VALRVNKKMTLDSGSGDIFVLPQRKFAQERARRTYESLIQAAFQVFADKGFDGAQTPDIAGAAGVSVGTFYRYFADKREIFLEVMQLYLQEGHAEVMKQLSPDKFAGKQKRATIEHTIDVLLDQVMRMPELETVFLNMSLRDREVARLRRHMEQLSSDRIAALIEMITTREQVGDPEATAYIINNAVVECAIRIAGFRGKSPVPRERAVKALSELVYRALFGAEPADE